MASTLGLNFVFFVGMRYLLSMGKFLWALAFNFYLVGPGHEKKYTVTHAKNA